MESLEQTKLGQEFCRGMLADMPWFVVEMHANEMVMVCPYGISSMNGHANWFGPGGLRGAVSPSNRGLYAQERGCGKLDLKQLLV